MKAGDFTNLASDYSQHRPDYCFSVLKALYGLLEKTPEEIEATVFPEGSSNAAVRKFLNDPLNEIEWGIKQMTDWFKKEEN